jgi:ssDNA-binding Zn-finger/Zn-ribbon topoisomerase 1
MRVSSDFTCDVEDMDIKHESDKKVIDVTDHVCTKCGALNLPEKVAKFSADKYGQVLCFKCQREAM